MHLSCALWNFLCFWQIYPDSQSFPKLLLQHISSCEENKKIKYICTCQAQQRALWSHVALGIFFYLLFGFFCRWSVQTNGHQGVEEGRTQRIVWRIVCEQDLHWAAQISQLWAAFLHTTASCHTRRKLNLGHKHRKWQSEIQESHGAQPVQRRVWENCLGHDSALNFPRSKLHGTEIGEAAMLSAALPRARPETLETAAELLENSNNLSCKIISEEGPI